MLGSDAMTEKERRLTEAVRRESGRLRNFIRARVPNEADVEDLLRDVVSELVAYDALIEPVRQVGAWLFRVARNRLVDRYRRQEPQTLPLAPGDDADRPGVFLEEWLPSPDAGPEAAFARGLLLDELAAALEELAPEQRDVFVAHQLEGRSFKELARETGLSVNTLLARKHYAVRHLRNRLRAIYEDYVNS
jgi:RNA polymerase sigma factor (sigma-70 family)